MVVVVVVGGHMEARGGGLSSQKKNLICPLISGPLPSIHAWPLSI